MRTVDKAIELLGFFSEREPELGLSDLSRRANFDKATSRRLLVAMAKHGFVEQNPDTRRYRIGPGVLRLAQVREATLPLTIIVRPILGQLVAETGETAHFALLSGRNLATVAIEESPRSNRVNMNLGESLPFHATASGLVILAFLDSKELKDVTQQQLQAFTENTPVGLVEIEKIATSARRMGYVINHGFFEADVCSIAAPVFGPSAGPMGALAVAAPKSRFTDETQNIISAALIGAAVELGEKIGGRIPSDWVA